MSYVLWDAGVALSVLVMAIYLLRLTVHKLPTSEVIVSAFLPLGPLGQGSYGEIEMAQSARTVFPAVSFMSRSLSTIALGRALSSEISNYLSLVFLTALVFLYLFVAGGSVHRILTGRVFTAPCLSSLLSVSPLASGVKTEDHCEEEK